MSLKTSDLLIHDFTLQASDVLDGLQRVLGFIPLNAQRVVTEAEASCHEGKVYFPAFIAHAMNECNYMQDENAQQRNDFFGIGVTGPGVVGAIFDTPEAGMRFAVAEYLLKTRQPLGEFAKERASYPEQFDRVQALVNGGGFPVVERIADLNKPFGDNDFVWMADPNGPNAVVQKGRALFPDLPDQIGGPVPTPTPSAVTFGNVPHPDYIDSYVSSNENTAWNDLGQRTVRGIVYHRMLGSLAGTDQFFHGGAAALTDYGVGVAAQDGDHLDGVLYRWNDPQGRRAGWSNGALSAPYGDGLAFFNQYGINAINRDLTSIEISGFQTTPLSAKSRRRIVELSAYWADRYHVSWETYPLIPAEGNRSFVLYHQEITIGTGKECPFAEVMNQTPSLIAETKTYLKEMQTDGVPIPPPPKPPKPPKYPRPIVPDALHKDIVAGKGPNQHVVDGITYKPTLGKWRATRSTRRMQQPIEVAKKVVVVGPSIKANTALTAWWETDRTLITRAGTSFYKAAFKPITKEVAKTLRATEAPVEGE